MKLSNKQLLKGLEQFLSDKGIYPEYTGDIFVKELFELLEENEEKDKREEPHEHWYDLFVKGGGD